MREDREVWIEADVPAPSPETTSDTWFPEKDEDGERQEGARAETGEGAPPTERLSLLARTGPKRSLPDFHRVYSEGASHRGDLLVLLHMDNGLPQPRCAVVASKRVGTAVQRNRAKRVLREALRLVRDRFEIGGRDLVLVARRRAAAVGMQQAAAELSSLLISAGFRVRDEAGEGRG